MRSIFINLGMLFTIIGITLFDNNVILKFLFLIGGVILAFLGLRMKKSVAKKSNDDNQENH